MSYQIKLISYPPWNGIKYFMKICIKLVRIELFFNLFWVSFCSLIFVLIYLKLGVWLSQNIQTFIKDQLFKVLFCKINTKFSLCFQRMKEEDCFLSLSLFYSFSLSISLDSKQMFFWSKLCMHIRENSFPTNFSPKHCKILNLEFVFLQLIN